MLLYLWMWISICPVQEAGISWKMAPKCGACALPQKVPKHLASITAIFPCPKAVNCFFTTKINPRWPVPLPQIIIRMVVISPHALSRAKQPRWNTFSLPTLQEHRYLIFTNFPGFTVALKPLSAITNKTVRQTTVAQVTAKSMSTAPKATTGRMKNEVLP